MHRALVPSLLLLTTACDPQNAVFQRGDFTAWLADTTSLSVKRGDILRFDEDGALVEDIAEQYDNYFTIDCREFEAAEGDPQVNEELRLDNRKRLCENEAREPDTLWPPEQEVWLTENGYHVINDTFEAWRGEAVLTSEGDAQLTFHHALPNGEDFRFSAVIDPNFQPVQCVEDGNGELSLEPIDGDWVENWSTGTNGQRLFYLNANASQFDPETFDNANERRQWFMPVEWRAGHAQGRFGDDNFRVRSNRFAEPFVYVSEETDSLTAQIFGNNLLYHCSPNVTDPDQRPRDNSCMNALVSRVQSDAETVAIELGYSGIPTKDDLPDFTPRVENNYWRDFDEFDSGLDAWVEMGYSWIAFDPGSEFTPGGVATGSFNIFFDGVESTSRFHVRGNFRVDGWSEDFWTTDYLPEIKAEENETVVCGERVVPEEE